MTDDGKRPLSDFPLLIAASRLDPVFYARHVLGVDLWSKQADAARMLRDSSELAVRSANGTGKTFLCGVLLNWWLDVWPPENESILTSRTFKQAAYTMNGMKALRRAARYRLAGTHYANAVVIGPRWHVRAFAARDPVAIQGPHALNFLAMVDEASGVSEPIFPAILGMMTTANSSLATWGNPNSAKGYFARQFRRAEPRKMTISAYDTPNFVGGRVTHPGLVTPQFVERLVRIYGKDSDVVRVRVLGLPPRQDAAAIIGMGDVENAKARGERRRLLENVPTAEGLDVQVLSDVLLDAVLSGERVGGLDVARRGGDDSALATFRGDRFLGIDYWQGLIPETAARAIKWLEEGPGVLLIDVGGMGVGVFDLVSAVFPARTIPVDFGGVPVLGAIRSDELGNMRPTYANRRSEMYYEAGRWLRERGAIDELVPAEILERLEEELTAPHGGMNEKSELRMESKERTTARIGTSPDFADAFVMGVAGILGGVEVYATSSAAAENDARRRGAYVDPDAGRRWTRRREFGGR